MGFFRRKDTETLPLTLRLASSSTFLWFGAEMWVRPEMWYAWIPSAVFPYIPGGNLDMFIYAAGLVAFLIGACLVTGRWVREAALIGTLVLAAGSILATFSQVGIRDVALMGLCLATAVQADQSAKKRLPDGWFGMIVGLYMLYMFIFGVMFLRAAPIPS
ncbi:MAG: hypothetical protein RLZZ324_533 [Candidatus Parcubacteria bacterium]|jgi:uncharacterized membrane protein YphA (DoxX/SURF4 family)